MSQSTHSVPASPLMLCDHLITLAQEADRAGYFATAGRLAALVESMFEEQPRPALPLPTLARPHARRRRPA